MRGRDSCRSCLAAIQCPGTQVKVPDSSEASNFIKPWVFLPEFFAKHMRREYGPHETQHQVMSPSFVSYQSMSACCIQRAFPRPVYST